MRAAGEGSRWPLLDLAHAGPGCPARALAVLAALGGTAASAATIGRTDAGCETMSAAVALTPGDPSDQTITAQYCTPAARATASATLARVLLTPPNPTAG